MANVDTASRWGSSTEAQEHAEGPVARRIEHQAAKLPSDTFLWAAIASMAVSAALQISGDQHKSTFIGQWAAPFLLLGLYNKMIKVAGSDRVRQS